MKKNQSPFFLYTICFIQSVLAQNIPKGFASIENMLPSMVLELRYGTTENFMGRVVDGYQQPKAVLTQPTLAALQKAQSQFKKHGLGIKLFDGYRPQRAVNDFVAWSKQSNDTLKKAYYYPALPKDTLFDAGYIAKRSGHSRGSTVDITLIHLEGSVKGTEVDMGSPWDFFGPISWTDSPEINDEQRTHRKLLQSVMIESGFRPYAKEWWHFTLNNEPFPNTYFNF